MKINSRFAPKCPTCRLPLPDATFHAGHERSWPCLACGAGICAHCYARHTSFCCPNLNVVPECTCEHEPEEHNTRRGCNVGDCPCKTFPSDEKIASLLALPASSGACSSSTPSGS